MNFTDAQVVKQAKAHTFQEVSVGCNFKHAETGNYYMKTVSSLKCNCVNLLTACHGSCDDADLVTPITVEITEP